jgi:hypothetical protein
MGRCLCYYARVPIPRSVQGEVVIRRRCATGAVRCLADDERAHELMSSGPLTLFTCNTDISFLILARSVSSIQALMRSRGLYHQHLS